MTTYVCHRCQGNTNRASRICRDCNNAARKRWSNTDTMSGSMFDQHPADPTTGEFITHLRQLTPTQADRVRAYFVRRQPELTAILADRRLTARCRKYHITIATWLHLVANQHARCAICATQHEPRALHIDHDHHTGAVRGLLCSTCNTGLGLLRIDGPDATRRTEAVMAYMRIAQQAHSISRHATA